METPFEERIAAFKKALAEADYVLIGGGAGASTAAGVLYAGADFNDFFGDFVKEYNFTDLYSASFHEFETQEEQWAFNSRLIHFVMLKHSKLPLYCKLYDLIRDKRHFVLTTNVDDQFARAGFDPKNIFATQGRYNLMQCSEPCHNKLYPLDDLVPQMLEKQKDRKIPSDLVPHCPVCGKKMTLNLRSDETFVEDDAWHESCARYDEFLKEALQEGKKLLLIEVGVGFNTPGIIRIPFERLKISFDKVTLVRMNKDYPGPMVEEAVDRHIPFSEDITTIFDLVAAK